MSVETFHEMLSEFTGKPTTQFIMLNKVNYISAKSATSRHGASPSIVIYFVSDSLEYNSKEGTSMETAISVAAKLSRLIQGD